MSNDIEIVNLPNDVKEDSSFDNRGVYTDREMNKTEQANNKKINIKFETTMLEKVMAIVVFPLAYFYSVYLNEYGTTSQIFLGIFTLAFLIFGEVMYWKKKRSIESYIFAGMTIIVALSFCLGIGNVWDSADKELFLHLFAVYWVLTRSGILLEKETSHLFVLDGIDGFFRIPFSNYLLSFKTIGSMFGNYKKKDVKRVIMAVGAIVVGVILLFIALAFLKASDNNFKVMMEFFNFKISMKIFWRLFWSIIVGLYLYGLFGGCFRMTVAQKEEESKMICSFLNKLNKVPGAIWMSFIGIFTAFYVLYFILQGSYIFGAFNMILPETVTFSEYARRGFGEMCAVMVVNFVLMWLTIRTSEVRTSLTRIFGTVLIGDSIVFALIAFLKLFMYIQAYGFTPLRLQSLWLICVLSFACICILVSLYTEKKTAKIWFIGSAIALGLLTLV